jgi:hypothetical protein
MVEKRRNRCRYSTIAEQAWRMTHEFPLKAHAAAPYLLRSRLAYLVGLGTQ